MQTKAQQSSSAASSAHSKRSMDASAESISPKKTALIIVTVVGCIAILWPKVFHPMMFGGTPPTPTNLKEQRGPGGIRQERPAHLHPESIYQAMRERGRAIPATPTVPIVDRKSAPNKPRLIDGRPGPVPGMRPPMGAGALQQPQAKGTSMGFVMPVYTIAIVIFFGYTIMKIVFKKPTPNAPYGAIPADPKFRREVFGHQNGSSVEDIAESRLGVKKQTSNNRQRNDLELYEASISATEAAANLSTSFKQHLQQCQQEHSQPYPSSGQQQQKKTQQPQIPQQRDIKTMCNKQTEQLMEIEKLRKKLEDTERAMAKLIAEMNTDQYEAKKSNENSTSDNVENISNGHTNQKEQTQDAHQPRSVGEIGKSEAELTKDSQRKRRDISAEREVTVLGMEVTASCEGGQKWTGRPPTPVLLKQSEHSKSDVDMPEPQSIYLEGSLAHESQILVTDSQTKREEVYDKELNGSPEEPAVVLSSKMTLSLINLDTNQQNDNENKNYMESPLADDIEIIGHDEH